MKRPLLWGVLLALVANPGLAQSGRYVDEARRAVATYFTPEGLVPVGPAAGLVPGDVIEWNS